MLVSTNDPRLPYFGTVCLDPNVTSDLGDNTPAKQIGQPNGYDNLGPTASTDLSHAPNYPRIPVVPTGDSSTAYQNRYSIVNRQTFARMDAPTFFLTYAETALLEAEAAERGWITGDPGTFYTAGVTAAMGQFDQIASNVASSPAPITGISSGAISAYLTANPYNAGTALNQINTQIWISLFMDEYEAFANWRRSGFPALIPIANYPQNVTGGTIPRRFTYSIGEASTNPVNYEAAVSRLTGGDVMTARMWWDTP